MSINSDPNIEIFEHTQPVFVGGRAGEYLTNLANTVREINPEKLVMIFESNEFVDSAISRDIVTMMSEGFDYASAYLLSVLAHNAELIPEFLRDRNNAPFSSQDQIDPKTGEVHEVPWNKRRDVNRFVRGQFNVKATKQRIAMKRHYDRIPGLSSESALEGLRIESMIRDTLSDIGWNGKLIYILIPDCNSSSYASKHILEFDRKNIPLLNQPWKSENYIQKYATKLTDIANDIRRLKLSTIDTLNTYAEVRNEPNTATLINYTEFIQEIWDSIGSGQSVDRKPGEGISAWIVRMLVAIGFELGTEIDASVLPQETWESLVIEHFVANVIFDANFHRRPLRDDATAFAQFHVDVAAAAGSVMSKINGRIGEIVSSARTLGLSKAISSIGGIDWTESHFTKEP